MPSTDTLRRTKLTITLSGSVIDRIDEIARKRATPRSRIMEEALREWLRNSEKRAMEMEIERYYLSLTKNEKREDAEWARLAAENAKKAWDD